VLQYLGHIIVFLKCLLNPQVILKKMNMNTITMSKTSLQVMEEKVSMSMKACMYCVSGYAVKNSETTVVHVIEVYFKCYAGKVSKAFIEKMLTTIKQDDNFPKSLVRVKIITTVFENGVSYSVSLVDRPVTRGDKAPTENCFPPLEKCVGHSLKNWALLRKRFTPLVSQTGCRPAG